MGQELPLTLLHDPPLKDLRGVVRKDLHRLLQDDGAAVALLADEVDGGAGQLDPVLQGLLMDVKAVTARSREGGIRAGWTLRMALGKARTISPVRMTMKPARTTRSMSSARSCSTRAAVMA